VDIHVGEKFDSYWTMIRRVRSLSKERNSCECSDKELDDKPRRQSFHPTCLYSMAQHSVRAAFNGSILHLSFGMGFSAANQYIPV
jgi:hypothetical protein